MADAGSGAVPLLETARLRLRGFRPEDFEAYAAMLGDLSVMRHVGQGQPHDLHGAWISLANQLGHWTLRGYGGFAVEERAGGSLIGRVGLWHPEGWPGCELAWMLARPSWGRGYATEAATAVRDWAFGLLGMPQLCSIMHPENVASKRVAAKLGATMAGEGTLLGLPVEVWRLAGPAMLAIVPERPDQAEVLALLEASDALSRALYPPESNHLLDPAALLDSGACFLVARLGGRAVGCGALLARADHGEIKRMFVTPSARGHGIGRAILERLEALAADRGLPVLRLETGIHNHDALRLYRKTGFEESGPFADYGLDPLSVFMEKPIAS